MFPTEKWQLVSFRSEKWCSLYIKLVNGYLKEFKYKGKGEEFIDTE